MTKFKFVGSNNFWGVENYTINSIDSLVKVHFNVIAYILREENQKAQSHSQSWINHKADKAKCLGPTGKEGLRRPKMRK